jgi:hypothetical protein
VLALHPAEVVHKPIEVLNCKLPRVGVGSNVQTAAEVEQGDVRKGVETGIRRVFGTVNV